MAGGPEQFEVNILHREERGETQVRCRAFGGEAGLLELYFRQSRRPGTPPPDLFVTGQVVARPGSGARIHFVNEFRATAAHGHIGEDYGRLRMACAGARLLTDNLGDLPHPELHYPAWLAALAAWDRGEPEAVVLLKLVYVLARKEGYAVKEGWFAGLTSRDRTLAATALNEPPAASSEQRAAVGRLLASLLRWLRAETEIAVEDAARVGGIAL